LTDPAELYIELLKRALTHTLYTPSDIGGGGERSALRRWIIRQLRARGLVRLGVSADAARRRDEGRDWPLFAQTMVGRQRLVRLGVSADAARRRDEGRDWPLFAQTMVGRQRLARRVRRNG